MKRTALLVIISVCVLVSAVFVAIAQDSPKAKVDAGGTKSWEYGLLQEMPKIKVANWDARPGKGLVEAKSIAELYKALGGTGALPDGGRVVLYNLLGSQGWELVESRKEIDGDLVLTLFKRPKQ